MTTLDTIRHLLDPGRELSFLNVENEKWNSFPLESIDDPTSHLDKSINGLYALTDSEGKILYVGKGKPIYGRLKSHRKATKGIEKAPAWRQFFRHFSKGIRAHWLEVDDADPSAGERLRKSLEQILCLRFNPLFDELYPKRKSKAIRNFIQRLEIAQKKVVHISVPQNARQ